MPTHHFLIVWSVSYAQWRTLSNPNRSSSQNMHTWLTYPSKSSDQDFRPISHWLATQRKIMENPRELHFSTREWHALTSMKNRATGTKSPPKSTYLAKVSLIQGHLWRPMTRKWHAMTRALGACFALLGPKICLKGLRRKGAKSGQLVHVHAFSEDSDLRI